MKQLKYKKPDTLLIVVVFLTLAYGLNAAETEAAYFNDNLIVNNQGDYVWIMSRASFVSDKEYATILKFLHEQNYDVSKVQKVPQQNKQSTSKIF